METKKRKDDAAKTPRPKAPATDSAFRFEHIIDSILDADPKAIEQHQAKRRRKRKAKKA